MQVFNPNAYLPAVHMKVNSAVDAAVTIAAQHKRLNDCGDKPSSLGVNSVSFF